MDKINSNPGVSSNISNPGGTKSVSKGSFSGKAVSILKSTGSGIKQMLLKLAAPITKRLSVEDRQISQNEHTRTESALSPWSSAPLTKIKPNMVTGQFVEKRKINNNTGIELKPGEQAKNIRDIHYELNKNYIKNEGELKQLSDSVDSARKGILAAALDGTISKKDALAFLKNVESIYNELTQKFIKNASVSQESLDDVISVKTNLKSAKTRMPNEGVKIGAGTIKENSETKKILSNNRADTFEFGTGDYVFLVQVGKKPAENDTLS
jgi:hypothetical protein